ncbi:predicted protein [Pyrenophora tritici-repentis Pt-1C-BFP]|uniref:Uncharacterized protein n=1 Tax=Pyrenophora tritici-repentis (strain Pt-1C-BFP) TaxID=426418 RepID=B2WHY3_PYRTR|nr:uncharacterized protein PTRG_09592 [Pyrenophora tritici-repentis Pt-1C-BFP]EDU42643.1 predicted protein [Pyrenophora tritici-repentis Pt-1C-BFP]
MEPANENAYPSLRLSNGRRLLSKAASLFLEDDYLRQRSPVVSRQRRRAH